MTPFHFSLLYFMLIKHNVSSFIWFYCFFFRFVALFACVWKKSFSSSYFFYLVLLFVLFLIFFFFFFCLFCSVCFVLFCFACFVLLFSFVFVFFLFHFRFAMYFFHLMDSFVLSTFQCPSDSHFSLSSL